MGAFRISGKKVQIPNQEQNMTENDPVRVEGQALQKIMFKDNDKRPRYELMLKYDDDFVYEAGIIINEYCGEYANRITHSYFINVDLSHIEIVYNRIHHSCDGEGMVDYFKITLDASEIDVELDITSLDSIKKLVNEYGVEGAVKELLNQISERIKRYANKMVIE